MQYRHKDHLRNARVDVLVDKRAVVQCWNNQGEKSGSLNRAMKHLFFTTSKLNILSHLSYVPSDENAVDLPSRRLSMLDCQLTPEKSDIPQDVFGGPEGHTCYLVALDSNAMKDKRGISLPHFTPYPTPGSLAVNLFAQDLAQHDVTLQRPYVLPPLVMVGLPLRFFESFHQSCAILVLDVYPRKSAASIVQIMQDSLKGGIPQPSSSLRSGDGCLIRAS